MLALAMSSAPPSPLGALRQDRIEVLQVVRGLACLVIVFAHANSRAIRAWPALPGFDQELIYFLAHPALDVFFVLSGFMMTWLYAGQFGRPGAASFFALRRAIRLVPLYWILTTLALALFVVAPQLFSVHRLIELPWAIGIYVFVPLAKADGMSEPIIGAGWALSYEAIFYALFALGMVFRRGLLLVVGALLALLAIGLLAAPETPALRLATAPYLIDFIAGIGLALLIRRVPTAPRGVALAAIIAGFSILPLLAISAPGRWALGAAGCLAGSLILAGCLWLNPVFKGIVGRALVLIGDAAYSIYLSHVFVLPATALAVSALGLHLVLDHRALLALLVIASACVGVGLWLGFERTLLIAMQRGFGRRKETQPAEGGGIEGRAPA